MMGPGKLTFLSLNESVDPISLSAMILVIFSYCFWHHGKTYCGHRTTLWSEFSPSNFIGSRDWYATNVLAQWVTLPAPKDVSNKKKTTLVYICKHLFSWTEKGLHQHIVQPCKITQKLKIRFLVHKCNESLMSSNPLQTMKTKFKPLKKFSALIKFISSGDKISTEENADEWRLVIGRTLKRKWNNFPA